MVGEACLPSNAYYPRTPDYTLCSGVHVCWSEHSDSSFVYGFMILDYGFGTMTATTFSQYILNRSNIFVTRIEKLVQKMLTNILLTGMKQRFFLSYHKNLVSDKRSFKLFSRQSYI